MLSHGPSHIPRPPKRESVRLRPRDVDPERNLAFQDHRLLTFNRGESEVEELAARIENRKMERITATPPVRMLFLKTCRNIAKEENTPIHKIRISALREFITVTETENQAQEHCNSLVWCCWRRLFSQLCGFRRHSQQLLLLLKKGLQVSEKYNDGYFYYMDFNHYYVKTESRWPWMRSSVSLSFVFMAFYYIISPILFCAILEDKGVCPGDPTSQHRAYYGWVSALYFASTTLSTVGYGNLTVQKDSELHLFVGAVYMVFSNVMLIVAFSAAADSSTSIIATLNAKLLQWIWGSNEDELFYRKIRRVVFLRIGQIVLTFFLLNAVGMIASLFILWGEEGTAEFSWMRSMYWVIQTTTTIGYGDVDMGFRLRWFQIVYLILSTYFVGNTLGGLAALKGEIHEILTHTAWSRRQLSKGLVDELQPYEHDSKVDQFEFVLGSLVTLGKVSYSDVAPIMDKFREMASKTEGYIVDPEEEAEE